MNDQKSRRFVRPGAMLCLSLSLAACGGGSGGSASEAVDDAPTITGIAPASVVAAAAPTLSPAPAPTPVPVPVPTPVLVPSSVLAPETGLVAAGAGIDTSCGLNGAWGIQAEILQAINTLRASGAVCGSTTYAATTPLNWNSMLLTAATGHSRDMAQSNIFSHVSPDGRTLPDRIGASGYSLSAAGENIAAGQSTVQEVMASWTRSPGHCKNMMNPVYRDVGVACMRNDASSYGLYWTMNLGRP